MALALARNKGLALDPSQRLDLARAWLETLANADPKKGRPDPNYTGDPDTDAYLDKIKGLPVQDPEYPMDLVRLMANYQREIDKAQDNAAQAAADSKLLAEREAKDNTDEEIETAKRQAEAQAAAKALADIEAQKGADDGEQHSRSR